MRSGSTDEPTIVDASHVEHAKPEPDLLLLAAEELGVEPRRLLVHRRLDVGHGLGGRSGDDPDRRDRGLGRQPRALEGAGAAAVVGEPRGDRGRPDATCGRLTLRPVLARCRVSSLTR